MATYDYRSLEHNAPLHETDVDRCIVDDLEPLSVQDANEVPRLTAVRLISIVIVPNGRSIFTYEREYA